MLRTICQASSDQSRDSRGRRPTQVRLPQPEALAGIVPRQCWNKPEGCSRSVATQRRAHDPSTLQPERERRSARGSGCNARCDGCSAGVGKLRNGLATGYAKTPELPNCFRLWWPGTELNRRRQPFQNSYYQCFQQLQWLPWDCQTLESTRKASGSWVIAVGDSTSGTSSRLTSLARHVREK